MFSKILVYHSHTNHPTGYNNDAATLVTNTFVDAFMFLQNFEISTNYRNSTIYNII